METPPLSTARTGSTKAKNKSDKVEMDVEWGFQLRISAVPNFIPTQGHSTHTTCRSRIIKSRQENRINTFFFFVLLKKGAGKLTLIKENR
jgi:hypothetical protein